MEAQLDPQELVDLLRGLFSAESPDTALAKAKRLVEAAPRGASGKLSLNEFMAWLRHTPTGAVPCTLHVASPGANRVAVYGGSFDPITNAHLLQAAEIIHAQLADEVWVVPCGIRPDKPSLKTAYMHRLHMCHLAVNTTYGARFPMRVCEIEMEQESAFMTLDLMKNLQAEYPSKDFAFLCGSDLYEGISCRNPDTAWEQGERARELSQHCKFIVIPRPGDESLRDAEPLPPNFSLARPVEGTIFSSQEMSSSELRKRVQRINYGDKERDAIEKGALWMIDGLIPAAVMAHIYRYKLYAIGQ